MGQRPGLLSFLGWAILVTNSLAIVALAVLWNNAMIGKLAYGDAMPAWWYKCDALAVSAGLALAGFGFLKGFDWSRYLFIGVHVASILIAYITDQVISEGPVAIVLVIATSVYLFRPMANEWFSQS
jgi:hypothetical protein